MLLKKNVKVGELVRNRDTRQVYLVVGKNTQGLMVINLMTSTTPAQIYMIVPGQATLWDKDSEINDLEEWEKDVLSNKLPLVDAITEEEDAN